MSSSAGEHGTSDSDAQPDDVIDRLVAQGVVTPARGDLLELPPPLKLRPGSRLPSEILEELRARER